jgi:hypothetical protein
MMTTLPGFGSIELMLVSRPVRRCDRLNVTMTIVADAGSKGTCVTRWDLRKLCARGMPRAVNSLPVELQDQPMARPGSSPLRT